jgi:3-phenylpropionate/trans-cinnamate dioxygenase ferredoxin reductase subunit
VDVRVGTGVGALRGASGRLTAVVTAAGEVLPADVVVVGIGASPRTGLAAAASLAVDDGIVVDAALRTTHPDVFAAGDVARAFSPRLGRSLRVEHRAGARGGGAAAARSMLGEPVSHDPVPFFYSDQYDWGLECSGYVGAGRDDRVVYRGDPAAGAFIAFWLAGDRLVAALNVNVWDVTPSIQQLISGGHRVDERLLRDPDVPLDQVTAATCRGAA